MFKKGEIYLAKLNPKKGDEVGKLRPVLIYQTDLLNDIGHPTTSVLPLSSILIEDAFPLRYRVLRRDNLEQDSDLLCDQIRTIDNIRIIGTKLSQLSIKEILEIDRQILIILDIEF